MLAQTVDPSWVDIASKFGVPVAILFAVCWMIWSGGGRVLKWIGTEVVIPVRDQAVKFFQDHTEWMRSVQKELREMADANTRHIAWEEERLDGMDEKLTELARNNGVDWTPPDLKNGNPKKTMRQEPHGQ